MPPNGGLLLGKLKCHGLSPIVTNNMLNAWRIKTRKTYNSPLKRWRTFCIEMACDVYKPTLRLALDFIQREFDRGLGYSALNVARSSLSAILCYFEYEHTWFAFGVHPCTKQLLKACYNQRPPKSRYSEFWDPDVVFEYLRETWPHSSLSQMELGGKLVTLFSLCSSQRMDTMAKIKVGDIVFNAGGCKILLSDLQKHTRVGSTLGTITLDEFTPDPKLCVIRCLKDYLYVTKNLRQRNKDSALFLSSRPPYRGVVSQTLGHWVRRVLRRSGIDTYVYGSHSPRGASASKLFKLNVSVKDIMQRACWTSESTFRHHYHKPITQKPLNSNILQESFVKKFGKRKTKKAFPRTINI